MALSLALTLPSRAEVTTAPPDFKEVYGLISSNLAGESPVDLDQAAVQGLLSQLHAKVSLVSGKSETNRTPESAPVVRATIYDGPIGYVRVSQVSDSLADKLAAACKDLAGTNQLKGIVLDLRFAGGQDYAAAAAAAGLFVLKDTPLLDWGTGMVSAKENKDAIPGPLVVLVNKQTAAAAEALAAVLRESAPAVILGATTAGEATIGRDFPLSNGQILRIATAGIKLGNGESLTAAGIKPDIQVNVKPADEQAYFADPFKELPSALTAAVNNLKSAGSLDTNVTTNHPRTRLTEADLIRERKEKPGMELDYDISPTDVVSDPNNGKPIVRDPVLGRALDLVKGISASLRPAH